MSREFEIKIPSFGGVQVSKSKPEDNDILMDFLLQVIDKEMHQEIKDFFGQQDDIEIIFGNESLCG